MTAFFEGAASWLLETSLQASLLAVMVWTILKISGPRLAPQWRHALWMLVAVRLALPAVPRTPWSPLGLLRAPAERPAAGEAPRPGFTVVVPRTAEPSPPPAAAAAPAVAPLAGSAQGLEPWPWRAWLAAVWLLGAALLVGRCLIASARLARHLRRGAPLDDPAALDVLRECARLMGVRRPPAIVLSGRVPAPALVGVLKPRIVLPAALLPRLSAADLRHVFLHELAHRKRLDAAWSWLMALLQCAHWLNPLVWWAFAHAREERELACDARALLASGREAAPGYGSTLIRLVEAVSRRPRVPGFAPGIHEGRRSLERRIEMITRFDCGRKRGSALAVLLLGACALTGLTAPQEPPRRRPGPRAPEAPKATVDPEVPTLAIVDIGPLLRVAPDFEAPRLGVVIGSDERKAPSVAPPTAEKLDRERRKKLDELVALIKSRVSPKTWGERWKIHPTDGDQLVLEAPHGVVEEVEDFIRKLIAERETFVHVELTLITLDPKAIDKLPRGLREKLPPAPPPGGSSWRPPSLLKEEVEQLLERGRAEGSVVRSLPALSAWDGQLAHNLVASEEAIIADLKVTGVNEKRKAEPIIGILRTGVVIQVRPALSEDRKRVSLDLGIETADVRRPIQAVVVEGSPVSVPELSLRQFKTSIDAPLGDWVLVSVPSAAGSQGLLVLKAARFVPEARE